jgi:hypothetical protein
MLSVVSRVRGHRGHWNGSVNLNMGTLGSGPSAGADAAGEQFVFRQGTEANLWEAWY